MRYKQRSSRMAPPSAMSIFSSTGAITPSQGFSLQKSKLSNDLLLSPFPNFCHNSVIATDHSCMLDIVQEDCSKVPIVSFQDCIVDDYDDRRSNHTDDSGVLSGGGFSNSESNFGLNLISAQTSPEINDTHFDFLQDLDDLDLDFVPTNEEDTLPEENFQSFIQAQLDESLKIDENIDDIFVDDADMSKNNDEDHYRKEFFLKHLGLARASSVEKSRLKNRKRKYEETMSSFSELETAVTNSSNKRCSCIGCNNTFASVESVPIKSKLLSNQIPHHTSTTRSPFCLLHVVVDHDDIQPSYSNNITITTDDSVNQNNVSKWASSNNIYQLTPRVPCKSCSCDNANGQNSVLYSTAKSSLIVQTSPSTASSGFQISNPSTLDSSATFFAELDANIIRNYGHISPSFIPSENILGDFEFEFMERDQIDEETEDLLKWLDSQQYNPSQPLNIIGNSVINKNKNDHSPSQHESPSSVTFSSSYSNDVLDTLLSPDNTHLDSPAEMETFVNLGSYATGNPVPVTHCELQHDTLIYQTSISKFTSQLSVLGDISGYMAQKEVDENNCQKNDNAITSGWEKQLFDQNGPLLDSKRRNTLNTILEKENIENLQMLDMFCEESICSY